MLLARVETSFQPNMLNLRYETFYLTSCSKFCVLQSSFPSELLIKRSGSGTKFVITKRNKFQKLIPLIDHKVTDDSGILEMTLRFLNRQSPMHVVAVGAQLSSKFEFQGKRQFNSALPRAT